MTDYVNSFIKKLSSINKYDRYTIFYDWCALTGIAIQNAVWYRESLEKEYLQIAKKYTNAEIDILVDMVSDVIFAFEENADQDFLGTVFMRMSMGDKKQKGQVFTPYHIGHLMAETALSKDNCQNMLSEQKYISIHDPACGGGCLLIAAANVIHQQGYNRQTHCCMLGIDLDRRCCWMTYIQLSLLGVPAIILHGNTLTMEITEEFHTPGYIWRHNRFKDFTKKKETVTNCNQQKENTTKGQLELF